MSTQDRAKSCITLPVNPAHNPEFRRALRSSSVVFDASTLDTTNYC
jgi:hypothetical protein